MDADANLDVDTYDLELTYDDLQVVMSSLRDDELVRLTRWAEEKLRTLPQPLHACDDELAARRRRFERVLACVAYQRGQHDGLLELQRDDWLRHERSALPYIQNLVSLDRLDVAATMARLALAADNCPDAAAIEELLHHTGKPPIDWAESVREFATHPSVEAWDLLMAFTPDDVYYQRVRNTLRMLLQLEVDPHIIFLCATRHGTTPDAIELIERGLVDPALVVQRGEQAPPEVRGLWLGLAAEAALARGDREHAVRLLREAYEKADPEIPPILHAASIRGQADLALHELLDEAGIPRF